jgi:HEAT repeat protein
VEWVLLIALRDTLPEVRIQAASGLSAIKAVAAIPRMIDLLQHDDPWVSARIADQLVQYGPEAVPLLLDALRRGTSTGHLDSDAVQLVTRVLGLIGDLRACPVLRPLLDHTIPEIRITAASALGSAGTVEAVKPLIRSLRDPDWRVRARSAAALATFSDPSSVKPLFGALDDDSWWVRQNTAEALTEIPGGHQALVEAIAHGSDGAREAAVTQLGLSGAIRSARDRVEKGDADPLERRLVSLIDRIDQRVRHAS